MNKFVVAAIVIAIGLAGAYALYQVQYGRLTTARIEQIKETTTKLDETETAVEETAPDEEAAQDEPVDMAEADTQADLASDTADPAEAQPWPETTPESFRVLLETTQGDITIDVYRDLSPNGADRFFELLKANFFDDARFFRVLPGFVAQFGIPGDPKLAEEWMERNMPDDPVKESNTEGWISYASAGPNTRSTQLFINYGDNTNLDGMGFQPFAKVVEGMEAAKKFYSGYGESPNQTMAKAQGNAYFEQQFPKLDYIEGVRYLGEAAPYDPNPCEEEDCAPDVFRIALETTKGDIVIEARREWAPRGVDRLYALAKAGYFNDMRLFRVVPGFVVQFGLAGDPDVTAEWADRMIDDDSVKETNRRGTLSFAAAGPNTRSTQLFINLADNTSLDGMGFAPVAEIVEGMDIIDAFEGKYADTITDKQMQIRQEGNAYLDANYPGLDSIVKATVIEVDAAAEEAAEPELEPESEEEPAEAPAQ